MSISFFLLEAKVWGTNVNLEVPFLKFNSRKCFSLLRNFFFKSLSYIC